MQHNDTDERPGWTAIDNAVIKAIPKLGMTAFGVYAILKSRADRDGLCWPSVASIGRDSGLSRRTVQYVLGNLCSAGLLTREDREGRASVYCLTRATGCTPPDGGRATDCTPGVQPIAREGCNWLHPEQEPKNNTQRTTPKSAAPTQAKRYRFEPSDLETAQWMFGLIQALDAKAKRPNLESWANDIRLTREADGRADADIRRVFGWANADPFWRSNILSPAKLREKFTALVARMNGSGTAEADEPARPALNFNDTPFSYDDALRMYGREHCERAYGKRENP